MAFKTEKQQLRKFLAEFEQKKNNLKIVTITMIATVGLLLPVKEQPRRTMHVQVLF